MSYKFKYIILLFSLLILTSGRILFNNPILLKIKRQFESYIQHHPQEKVYLHIDKKQTTLGETIWFKVYLVDAWWHTDSAISNLVYVELIDPKQRIVDTRQVNMNQEMAAGDFQIHLDSMPGNYTIRAYTNYMRNFDEAWFYQQQIQVWDPYDTSIKDLEYSDTLAVDTHPGIFNVQFFPEGGDLVNGLKSKVAFKISGSGKQQVVVKIVDQEKNFITQAATISQGMGFFNIRPEQGKIYHAEFNREGEIVKFPLPEALHEGYLLKVIHKSGRNPSIIMETNIKDGLMGAFVIGQMRGQICFTIEGNSSVPEMEGQIPTQELPDGICQFTLFNPKGEPVCERLVFIQNPQNQVEMDIITEKPDYGTRQEVKVELEINDYDLEEGTANISCSVIDQAVSGDEHGKNIQSYLLLSSELQGQAMHSFFPFDSMNAGRRLMQDLLMLTHGWRRFVWKKILDEEVSTQWQYLPERGFTIAGYTTRVENQEKTIASQVYISAMGPDGFQMGDQITGPEGTFRFRNLYFTDTSNIILQANIFNQKKTDKRIKKEGTEVSENIGPKGNRYVAIYLQKEAPPKCNLFYQESEYQAIPETDYLEDRRMINQIDSSYNNDWQINIKEIVVKGRKTIKPKEDNFNNYYGTPSDRLILDSLPWLSGHMSVFDLLRGRVPGVQVFGSGAYQYAVIRGSRSLTGNSSAQLFLDGLSIENDHASTLNIYDVAAIDVYKGTAAGIFGGRGANGVIVIHTRTRSGVGRYAEEVTTGIMRFKHPGYNKAREFYSPDYSEKRPDHIKPDFRTTLYWKPYITPDSTGNYAFSFYTSDKKTDYRIIVEGITSDGWPIYKETVLSVH